MEESNKTRKYRIAYALLIAVVAVMVLVFPCFWWSRPTTTILLVRHAEKAGESGNVNLSDDGLKRAQALVGVANEAGIAAVYSTKYCRTAQTAQPLVQTLGLSVHVWDSADPEAGFGGCDPPISVPVINVPGVDTPTEVVQHVLHEHRGQTVLLVDHSPTIPEMVKLLGEGSFAPVEANDFSKLFIVSIRRFFIFKSTRLIKARYGD